MGEVVPIDKEQREQQKKFIEQMKYLQGYAGKCGQGQKPLEGYLESLYSDIDNLLNVPIEVEERKKIEEAVSNYKSSLKSARMEISKYTKLDKLVKKAISGSIGSEEEAKQVMSEMDKTYGSIVNAVLGMYQLLDPAIDASKLINGIYLKLAEHKKVDIKSKFQEGVGLIKKYYFNRDIEKIISEAQAKQKAA